MTTVRRQFVIYTVYDNPLDYPGQWVIRRFFVSAGQVLADFNIWSRSGSLEAARATLPPHAQFLRERYDDDDPKIVEAWISD